MATELYDLTAPVFLRGLRNLKHILEKGEAFAAEKGIDPATLTGARLIEDMHPLTNQVQRVSDSAKNCMARLAGEEAPAMPDEEQTFEELKARLDRTIAYVESIRPEQINGQEQRDVVLKFPNGQFDFKGLDYVLSFALPNFYFHVTTTYALLRQAGVPIGKTDYIAGR